MEHTNVTLDLQDNMSVHKHCISIEIWNMDSYLKGMFTFNMDICHHFFYLLTQDISQKLGMLQEEYDNATAMTRTLGADLTGKKSHIWRYLIKIEYG